MGKRGHLRGGGGGEMHQTRKEGRSKEGKEGKRERSEDT